MTVPAPAPPLPQTAREAGIMQGFPPPADKRPGPRNWDLPPFNRWSFQNMHRLFPTADVFRGFGPVAEFKDAPADLGAVPVPREDGRRVPLSRTLRELYADGILVLHRGRLVQSAASTTWNRRPCTCRNRWRSR